MEFLKELFGDQPLTYDQLAEKVKEKGLQLVDVAGGAYVPKKDAEILAAQLEAANKKLEGYDPAWKAQAEAARKQLEAQQFDFALEKAVAAAKPRNTQAVLGLLDREKLSFAAGEVIGLDKQMERLKKGEDTAFLFEEVQPVKTGLSHQNAHEVGGNDKKDAANEALRSVFGGGA